MLREPAGGVVPGRGDVFPGGGFLGRPPGAALGLEAGLLRGDLLDSFLADGLAALRGALGGRRETARGVGVVGRFAPLGVSRGLVAVLLPGRRGSTFDEGGDGVVDAEGGEKAVEYYKADGAKLTEAEAKDVVLTNPNSDGKAEGNMSVGWWGSCDKVALAGILFEDPKRDVTLDGV